MRKLAMCTGLLGAGALRLEAGQGAALELSPLLYLVPVAAIAFDVHVVAEDFRIKRIGEFLERRPMGASEDEREWGRFVQQRPNRLSPLSFSVSTAVLLIGASLLLQQAETPSSVFWPWLLAVVACEVSIVKFGNRVRKWV